MSRLSLTDVAHKLDTLAALLRDAERLAKELDAARIGDWYGRADLNAGTAARMESRAQDASLVAHEIGRRMDLVAHLLRSIRPFGPVPPAEGRALT